MSAPIQKSVVYQAAMKIYIETLDKMPESVSDYLIPGTKITYRQREMRNAAEMAWEMVSAVDATEPK